MNREDVKLKNTYTVCSNYMKVRDDPSLSLPDGCQKTFATQLRNMGNGAVRNQPQCPKCRGRYGH